MEPVLLAIQHVIQKINRAGNQAKEDKSSCGYPQRAPTGIGKRRGDAVREYECYEDEEILRPLLRAHSRDERGDHVQPGRRYSFSCRLRYSHCSILDSDLDFRLAWALTQ